jgi:hypothetical protein
VFVNIYTQQPSRQRTENTNEIWAKSTGFYSARPVIYYVRVYRE